MVLEELRTAGNLLNAALERYRTACLAIANSCGPENPLKSISQTISDVVHRELELIASFETKTQEVKAIVCQTRNVVPAIVPVAVLPSDILAHIFTFVLNAPPRYCWKPGDHYAQSSPSLKYPETLSRVCTRWRQVAITSHSLWSHIDIIVPLVNGRLLTRAKILAARGPHIPLDVHISCTTDGNKYGGSKYDDAELHAFCASIATRVKSLELSVRLPFEVHHYAALRSCFAYCTPGTLHQLVVTGRKCSSEISWNFRPPRHTILASDIGLPEQHLDDLFRPVSVLRLHEVYFDWSSQVYHGLVELYLTRKTRGLPPFSPMSITLAHLVKILTASPGLRTFHFGLRIAELLPPNVSYSPISLRDLEEVDLRLMDYPQYDALFQLLSPGSKPLRLSLEVDVGVTEFRRSYDEFIPDEFFANEFFTSSMITELSISSNNPHSTTCISLLGLLELLPLQSLQVLSLSVFSFDRPHINVISESDSPVDENEHEYSSMCSQLHALHLRSCTIAFDELQWVAEMFPLQVLEVQHCFVRGEDSGGFMERHQVKEELAKMFPTINLDRCW